MNVFLLLIIELSSFSFYPFSCPLPTNAIFRVTFLTYLVSQISLTSPASVSPPWRCDCCVIILLSFWKHRHTADGWHFMHTMKSKYKNQFRRNLEREHLIHLSALEQDPINWYNPLINTGLVCFSKPPRMEDPHLPRQSASLLSLFENSPNT